MMLDTAYFLVSIGQYECDPVVFSSPGFLPNPSASPNDIDVAGYIQPFHPLTHVSGISDKLQYGTCIHRSYDLIFETDSLVPP
jgi:hypothetical protein